MIEAPHTDQDANGASKKTQVESVGQDHVQAKRFATLQAKFAMRGHALNAVASASGRTTYFAEKWGLVRWLDDLDAAEVFLTKIGG